MWKNGWKEFEDFFKNSYKTAEDKSDAEEEKIVSIINSYRDQFEDFHKLKTRKSGNMKHIDFHLTVGPDHTVHEIHKLIGDLKKDMWNEFNYTRVSVHVDPYLDPAQSDEALPSE